MALDAEDNRQGEQDGDQNIVQDDKALVGRADLFIVECGHNEGDLGDDGSHGDNYSM